MEIEVNRFGRRFSHAGEPSRQFRSRRRSPASTKPLARPAFSVCRVFAVCGAPTISRLPFPNDAIAGNPLSRSIQALYPKRRSGTPVMMWNRVLTKQFHARATKPPHLLLSIIRGGCERGPAFALGRDAAWIKDADASPGHGPARGLSPASPSPTRQTALSGFHRNRSSISPSDSHGATASN